MSHIVEGATVQMRLDVTTESWEDLDGPKLEAAIASEGWPDVTDWVVKRNELAGAITHRIIGDSAGRAMYLKGRRESDAVRKCDTDSCPCTLTYWDRKLGNDPRYNAFLDGWTDAAVGRALDDPEGFGVLYEVGEPTGRPFPGRRS